MSYKVSFKFNGRKMLSPRTFRTKASARRAIRQYGEIKAGHIRSKYIKHYRQIKNPRIIHIARRF